MNSIFNSKPVNIAIDAMGGDHAPDVPIHGIQKFLSNNPDEPVFFTIFGDKEQIAKKMQKYKIDESYYSIVHCDEYIPSDMKPSMALRKSGGSSMRSAIESVAKKECDASVSGGNTGALMALSKIILKTVKTIDRPAICSTMPTIKGRVVLLDMGANIDVTAENLFQFAIMGSAYAKVVLKKKSPKIGLLNIGSEDIKGHAYIQEAAEMIKNSHLKSNFIGNVEPDQIYEGDVDVVVTDGFTGNVIIKSAEGLGRLVKSLLSTAFTKSLLSLTGYGLAKRSLKKSMKSVDPNNYNGAMFIGLNGVSVKSHGGADYLGFANAISNAYIIVKDEMNKKIVDKI
jgi:glycerol-3-phosphate acyltransferase PlsX